MNYLHRELEDDMDFQGQNLCCLEKKSIYYNPSKKLDRFWPPYSVKKKILHFITYD